MAERRRKKRGQGEGSIYQRADGVWVASVSLGTENGRRRRRTVYGRTKTEVKQKLQALLAELQTKGTIPDPTRLTVAQYLDQWAQWAAGTVRPSTMESYRVKLEKYIKPAIGHIQLDRLQPFHIQALYDQMLASGLSRRTVEYTHAILRRAMRRAVKLRLIPAAPTDGVDAPRAEHREMTVLTPDQLEKLAQALSDDPLGPLYYLAMVTGARRGELIALRWDDIDWENRTVTINRAATVVNNEIRFDAPKSRHSRRTIPLTEEAIAVLRRHRIAQAEQKLRLGPLYEDHGLVFPRPNGRPQEPSQVSKHFRLILQRAGLPHVRLHDLRHTHATLMLAAGVHPRVAAERLGDTVHVTMTTYSHVLPSMQQEVTEKLAQLLPAMPAKEK